MNPRPDPIDEEPVPRRRLRIRKPRRVAMISMHTSPLEQPGTGDAGGLNVYVAELATALGRRGVRVDIFTRATSSRTPELTEMVDGVVVRTVQAGPYENLDKDDLPGQLCSFVTDLLHIEAAHPPGWYDVVHSHYWLSGQAGRLVSDRWGVPLVHSMHTMAKVKNESLAPGDRPEPAGRVIGEEEIVRDADALVANTAIEERQLIDLYGADPDRVCVVPPGVDLSVFNPGRPVWPADDEADRATTQAARRELGLDPDATIILFVGRIQPLKAPDVVIRAIAELVGRDAGQSDVAAALGRRRLTLAVLGGPSGSGAGREGWLHSLAGDLGVGDIVNFHPPVDRARLAQWYRAADVVAVPSYSESFGLVAVEAQACGTPVVAANVGGLRTTVADGHTGVLVHGHNPARWARALADLLADEPRRAQLGRQAASHASQFGWDSSVDAMLDLYRAAARTRRSRTSAAQMLQN